jgi:hypothetical protein
MSPHRELLGVCGEFVKPAGGRSDFDLHAPRLRGGIGLATLLDPAAEGNVSGIALLQLLAAAVRDFHERLHEQQALIRIERVRAAAKVLADQRQVIEHRIKGPQGKAEAPLAAW